MRSAHSSSWSAAAARNVSAAASTTRRPSPTCCDASLPIVVVFPTPLTPTNIHTFGSPATRCSVAVGARRRGARPLRRARSATSPSASTDVVGLGAGAHRVEDALRRRRARRRRAATPLRDRPRSSSSILRPRIPLNAPENAARVRPSRSRSRGFSTNFGLENDRRRELGVELRDRLVDRRRERRVAARRRSELGVARWASARPRVAAGSPGATGRLAAATGAPTNTRDDRRATTRTMTASNDDDDDHGAQATPAPT